MILMEQNIKKSDTISVTKRVNPSLKKTKKCIALSRSLWAEIEVYASKQRLNRSKAIGFMCRSHLSADRNQILSELKVKRIELAILEQQLKNLED